METLITVAFFICLLPIMGLIIGTDCCGDKYSYCWKYRIWASVAAIVVFVTVICVRKHMWPHWSPEDGDSRLILLMFNGLFAVMGVGVLVHSIIRGYESLEAERKEKLLECENEKNKPIKVGWRSSTEDDYWSTINQSPIYDWPIRAFREFSRRDIDTKVEIMRQIEIEGHTLENKAILATKIFLLLDFKTMEHIWWCISDEQRGYLIDGILENPMEYWSLGEEKCDWLRTEMSEKQCNHLLNVYIFLRLDSDTMDRAWKYLSEKLQEDVINEILDEPETHLDSISDELKTLILIKILNKPESYWYFMSEAGMSWFRSQISDKKCDEINNTLLRADVFLTLHRWKIDNAWRHLSTEQQKAMIAEVLEKPEAHWSFVSEGNMSWLRDKITDYQQNIAN